MAVSFSVSMTNHVSSLWTGIAGVSVNTYITAGFIVVVELL